MNALDRDAARNVLRYTDPKYLEETLDALESCVRPSVSYICDRDALAKHLCRREYPDRTVEDLVAPDRALWQRFLSEADDILALLRPVGGITLTRAEAEYAQRWLPIKNSQRARDIAARLGAAQ